MLNFGVVRKLTICGLNHSVLGEFINITISGSIRLLYLIEKKNKPYVFLYYL